MPEVLNGELLRVARQYRGIDAKDLAASLAIDPAIISRAENGVKPPADATISRIADQLGFPREFFYQSDRLNGLPLSTHPQWRKRKSVKQRSIDQVLADFNIRIFHLRRLLSSLEYEPKLPVPQYDLEDYEGDVEKIAEQVRRAWNIPRGPIANLTEIVETAGIFVFHVDMEEAAIDGATITAPGMPPCIFLNKALAADRMRFTLAHEIGHIILHRFPSEHMEAEANHFAGSLLVPQADVHNDFAGQRIDLRTLARLKPEWRVAMQSLLYRASELGYVDRSRTTYLWKQFNINRWKMREPSELDFEQEQPILAPRLLDLHFNELGYSLDEMQNVLCMFSTDLARMYELNLPKPGLRVVS
jgi:Zn-dependent peptidase ImmA (M78 family)/transcriptional regulator with XRE-family HTH domain